MLFCLLGGYGILRNLTVSSRVNKGTPARVYEPSDKLPTCISLGNNRRLIHVYPRGQHRTHYTYENLHAGLR